MTYQPRWETLPELVTSAADRFGDAEAVVDGPLRLTFADLVSRIGCAAGAFADLGIAAMFPCCISQRSAICAIVLSLSRAMSVRRRNSAGGSRRFTR